MKTGKYKEETNLYKNNKNGKISNIKENKKSKNIFK